MMVRHLSRRLLVANPGCFANAALLAMAPVVAGLLDEVIECANIGLSPAELLRRPLNGRAFDLIIDTQRVALASLVLWRMRHKHFVSPFGKFILSTKKPPKGYRFPKSMQRQMLDLLEIASGHTIETPKTLDLALDLAGEQ